jgi:hypothetical protein
MNFDGRTIEFDKAVVARDDDGWLQTNSLAVTLSQEIRFGQASAAATTVDVQNIACHGAVRLHYRTRANEELASLNDMVAGDLSIDRASGRIHAAGPGWISSVRRNRGELRVGRLTAASPKASADAETRPLEYLRVDYDREADGNLHQQTLTFFGGVRAVYGPVDAWNAHLPVDDPDGVGPDNVRLTSDTLSVTQVKPMPVKPAEGSAGRPTLELDAQGNALVEGETFFARAARMSYIQAKDLMILEGTGTTAARLWRQTRVGAPSSEVAARKILFWQRTERVRVDEPMRLNLNEMSDSTSDPEAVSTPVQRIPR